MGAGHPDGVVVPLRLTHATLAQLVGASRPSVSTMPKMLEVEGIVERLPDGWLLHGAAPAAEPAAAEWATAA